MKRTEKINIQGIVFNIDEDAYVELKKYLSDLERYFKAQYESLEAYNDIELRIVELLQEKLNNQKQVVTIADVDEIIQTLGKIGDFSEQPETNDQNNERRRSRRLYRDLENSYIGGVCAGIGAYFNIETTWIRLAFLLAVFMDGFGLLVYLIMWIVIPKAVTAAQRIEMHGDEVNINNIENSIRDEYQRVKDNVNSWQKSAHYHRTRDGFYRFFAGMGLFFGGIFRFIIVMVGIAIVIAGVFAFLGVSGFGFYQLFDIHYFDWDIYLNTEYMLSYFIPNGMIEPVVMAIWLLVAIPVVTILYLGLKMIFQFKAKDGIVGALMFGTFILALIFIAAVAFMQYLDFDEEISVTESIELPENIADTVHFNIHENLYFTDKVIDFDHEAAIDFSETNGALYIQPDVSIEHTSSEHGHILIQKSSYGEDRSDARDNINAIDYNIAIEEGEINLNEFFRIHKGDYYRGQEVDITIKLPKNTYVVIPWNSDDIIRKWSSDIEQVNGDLYVVD